MDQFLDSTLDKLREMKWLVVAHYEFMLHRQLRTVWFFVHVCGQSIKAEGASSSELLVLQMALGDALAHTCNHREEGKS
jgi:hypothetical protein